MTLEGDICNDPTCEMKRMGIMHKISDHPKDKTKNKLKLIGMTALFIGAVVGAISLQLAIGGFVGYTDPFAVNP